MPIDADAPRSSADGTQSARRSPTRLHHAQPIVVVSLSQLRTIAQLRDYVGDFGRALAITPNANG